MTLLPGFTQVKLGKRGDRFRSTSHPKLEWHTWESLNWSAAEGAYTSYPPHAAVFPPWPGHESKVGRRQYIPLNLASYSNKANDIEYIIQIEVAGFAEKMRDAPDVVLRWLVENVMLPIEKAMGVPRAIFPRGLHDATTYRPKNRLNYLASARSETRGTVEELRGFSGHLGHQNMPAPDTHWDPGGLRLQRMFDIAAKIEPSTQPITEDDMPIAMNEDDARRAWVRSTMWRFLKRGPVTVDEFNIHVYVLATSGEDATLAGIADSPEAAKVADLGRRVIDSNGKPIL